MVTCFGNPEVPREDRRAPGLPHVPREMARAGVTPTGEALPAALTSGEHFRTLFDARWLFDLLDS